MSNFTKFNGYDVEDSKAREDINLINNNISSLSNEINVERERINNLSSLEEGSTTADAELIDIRTDYKGITHSSAGESVRNQTKELSKVLNFAIGKDVGVNIIFDDLNKTVGLSGSGYIFNKYSFENAYHLQGQSVSLVCTQPTTSYIYIRNKTLCIDTLTSYVPQNKDIIICMLMHNASGDITQLIWSVDTSDGDGTPLSNNFAKGIGYNAFVVFNEDDKTVSVNGNGYIFGSRSFINVSVLSNQSVSLVCTQPTTSYIYIRNNTLCIDSIVKYKALYKDVIIAEVYHYADGSINQIIWCVDEQNKINTPTNEKTCSIFQKVCCVGDSYTAGYIKVGDSTTTVNEKYSYPAFMSKITGNEFINCGSSGATVLSWLNSTRGLAKAQSSGKVQAYLIGLGLNDIANVELGVVEDIGTDNSTYYGGLSKIVRELKTISPDAMIFIQTMPRTSGLNYNEAIRNIVNEYAETYDTHLLDLENYMHMYSNKSLADDYINGHYTAIGYQQFAEILCKIWSDYINNNVSKFQSVHLIEYDE